MKRALFAAVRALGGHERLADSAWRRERLLVLCYHGVSLHDEHEWDPQLYVTQEFLRRRFELLRRNRCTVLALDEAVDRLGAGTLPPRAVAITFDDGTFDFHARALPLLREFGFPATVYACTYYCGVQLPVFDPVLRYIGWRGRARKGCEPWGIASGEAPLRVDSAVARDQSALRIRHAALRAGLDARAKDRVAREFAHRLGVSYDEIVERRILHLMTPAELRDLPPAGVDVQLHSHRHRLSADPEEVARELADNRAAIRVTLASIGDRSHFCYPSGAFDVRMADALRALGVRSATTCEPGLATRKDDPLRLPRFVDTLQQDELAFEMWLSGWGELLSAVRRTSRSMPALDEDPRASPPGVGAGMVAAAAAFTPAGPAGLRTPSSSSASGSPSE